jgi:hypothetical protein
VAEIAGFLSFRSAEKEVAGKKVYETGPATVIKE